MLTVNEIWPIKKDSTLYNKAGHGSNCIYGEVSEQGARDIVYILKPTKKDVIIDVGSGGGKLCAHLALETDAKVIGVELIPHRHKKAMDLFGEKGLENLKYINASWPIPMKTMPNVYIIHGLLFNQELVENIYHSIPPGSVVLHNCKSKDSVMAELKSITRHRIAVSYMQNQKILWHKGVKS